jgi:hypothetical protein
MTLMQLYELKTITRTLIQEHQNTEHRFSQFHCLAMQMSCVSYIAEPTCLQTSPVLTRQKTVQEVLGLDGFILDTIFRHGSNVPEYL